jgi:hypothetical protein
VIEDICMATVHCVSCKMIVDEEVELDSVQGGDIDGQLLG